MKVKSYIGEIWVDIIGYEGLYMISNYGRVKSLNYNHTGKEEILKTSIERGEHLFVVLYKNRIRKKYSVHRLVATHFIPNPENKPEVHHRDHNPQNNNVENLVWLTYEEHKAEHPEVFDALKKANSKHINQFTRDGLFVRAWYSAMDIERELGYANTHIIDCCKGKLKTSYGFIWKYAEDC